MHREGHREAKFVEETRSNIGHPFGPSSASHDGISDRQTPGLLEMSVSCCKQRKGVISNRQSFAFFLKRFVRLRTPLRAPACRPLHLPFLADHHPLTCPERSRRATDRCTFLIGTPKFSQFRVTYTKQSTGPVSNRDKFQHLLVGISSFLVSLFSVFRVSPFDSRLHSLLLSAVEGSLVTCRWSLCR